MGTGASGAARAGVSSAAAPCACPTAPSDDGSTVNDAALIRVAVTSEHTGAIGTTADGSIGSIDCRV
jgi:hypothetical protein